MKDVTENTEYLDEQAQLLFKDKMLFLTAAILLGKISRGEVKLMNADGKPRPTDEATLKVYNQGSRRFATLMHAADKAPVTYTEPTPKPEPEVIKGSRRAAYLSHRDLVREDSKLMSSGALMSKVLSAADYLMAGDQRIDVPQELASTLLDAHRRFTLLAEVASTKDTAL